MGDGEEPCTVPGQVGEVARAQALKLSPCLCLTAQLTVRQRQGDPEVNDGVLFRLLLRFFYNLMRTYLFPAERLRLPPMHLEQERLLRPMHVRLGLPVHPLCLLESPVHQGARRPVQGCPSGQVRLSKLFCQPVEVFDDLVGSPPVSKLHQCTEPEVMASGRPRSGSDLLCQAHYFVPRSELLLDVLRASKDVVPDI